ncbi:hypothetical protein [Sinorhizobium sp. CCBAU 05631]|uniref:hypothetical protein n=1 Tax=Sinorhizobium sp. CCBAU 05631 TaxID=794846 RepID=UPI0004BB4DCF|nr:hypothetical protein [Sinorhizobium sp. CCBAU 05631]ASY56443.1 hypothetical protein SS05631_c15070 [Sinorhizobium sp. CCBAU 05631]
MKQPEASPQQKRFDAIRNRVDLASREWGVRSDGRALCLTAVGDEVIATIVVGAPFADSEMVLNAPADLIWLLDAYSTLARRYRELRARLDQQQPEQKAKDYAAECAMKCSEPAFKKFLEERHGLARPLTDERVVTKLRSILNIRSRAELNNDPAAAARWQNLRGDFDAWRRR